MLSISHVSLSFGAEYLCQDLSFSLNPSEIGLLMAPSGAGKSTLLKWIAGLEISKLNASGNVMLNGNTLNHVRAEKRQIGVLFQHPLLFPHLNVADNISFGMQPISPAENQPENRAEKIANLLEAAGMAGFEKRDPETLSGGQQARIAMLRSVAAAPKALLLDEPFSSLDDVQRTRILQLLSHHIQTLNIPVLLVSHDPRDEYLDTAVPVKKLSMASA